MSRRPLSFAVTFIGLLLVPGLSIPRVGRAADNGDLAAKPLALHPANRLSHNWGQLSIRATSKMRLLACRSHYPSLGRSNSHRKCFHGQARRFRRTVERDPALVAPAQTAPLPLSRP